MPGKKRALGQMMEDKSLAIIRRALPKELVVRDYKPDFGIDLAIDLLIYRAAGATVVCLRVQPRN